MLTVSPRHSSLVCPPALPVVLCLQITGAGGDPSLLAAFMDRGAACGIGSFADIFPPYVGLLSNYFWEFACRDGWSIAKAFRETVRESGSPWSWWIDPETNVPMPIGSGDVALRPARYH